MPDLGEKFAQGELTASEGHGPEWLRKKYGQQLEHLPQNYQEELRQLCQKIALRDMFARIEEVKRAAEQRFYWRNMMGVCWNDNQGLWVIPGMPGYYKNENETGDIPLSYPINIYQAFGRGFIAMISEVPSVRFEATGETPDKMRIASSADQMRKKIEAQNHMDDLMIDVARLAWTDGRVVFWNRWVCDGAVFGYEDEAHPDEVQEGLGEGGDPPKKSPRKPKGGEKSDPYGVLEAKVPINMRSKSQWPFCQISYEVDSTSAKALYPWYADRIQGGEPGPAEYMFDRVTRVACTQGIRLLVESGDSISQLPTLSRTWMRPAMFAEIETPEIREFFEDNFPDGVCVVFVGNAYCESRNESLDDHITVYHPLPGDGQATPSCGAIIMPVQDLINDLTDLMMERSMKTIPAVIVAQGTLNMQALSKEHASPGAHYETINALEPNETLANRFFVEPIPGKPEGEAEFFTAMISDIPQFLTGLHAAALGDSDPNNETASGIDQLQRKSRGQGGVAWRPLRKTYAENLTQLVRVGAYFRASESEDGMVKIDAPGAKPIEIDLEDLREGNWCCVPDGDESYPNTHAEKQAAMQQLAQMINANPQSPLSLAITGSPKNIVTLKSSIGVSELEFAAADSEEKQLAEIQQMLDEPPIPNTQAIQAFQQGMMQWKVAATLAQAQGQPPPPQPPPLTPEQEFVTSMPIDAKFDDNPTEFKAGKDWLNTSEGQNQKRTNPKGVLNVRLHLLSHGQAAQGDAQQAMQTSLQPQLLLEKAKHSGQEKSPSESINFKDLGPQGKLQVAAQAGIDIHADVASELAGDAIGEGSPSSHQAKPPASARRTQ